MMKFKTIDEITEMNFDENLILADFEKMEHYKWAHFLYTKLEQEPLNVANSELYKAMRNNLESFKELTQFAE